MVVIDTSDNVSEQIPLLRSKGVTAVGRYYSSAAWKRVTTAEAQAIAAAGLKLFVIFENDGDPPLDGDAGTTHGQIALQQARGIGQPYGSAIYFGMEHLPDGYKASHVPGVKTYFEQLRSVMQGKYKLGVYSDGVICDALLSSGLCDYAWLSASTSFEGSQAFYQSGRWSLAQQTPVDQNWNGLSVDTNEAKSTFGEFVPGTSPVPRRFDASVALHAEVAHHMELDNVFLAAASAATPRQLTAALAATLKSSQDVLNYARNIGTAIVDGPANHCAATLSALLVFIGIFPNGGGTGKGDLEPLVVNLAWDLEKRRRWVKVTLGQPIIPGDVGVVLVDQDTHHIYLVVDATNQTAPIIADNQLAGIHARPLAGDPAQNFSPTNYLLRAPG
jgi:hypothetical protein